MTYKLGVDICKKKRIDIISAQDSFVSGIIGYFLKKRFKIPLNIQMHSDLFRNKAWTKSLESKLYSFIYDRITLFTLRRADSIRVVSQKISDALISRGIAEEKIYLAPSPIVIAEFKNIDATKVKALRNELLGERFEKVILFVGRLSVEKNIIFLLKAFSEIKRTNKKYVLLIIGSGPEATNLKKQADSLGLREQVIFSGPINNSDIAYYYKASDVFAFPSYAEGRGTVLYEAAISRLPIVTVDVGDAKKLVIDGETGFLVQQNNIDELSGKLLFLLQHNDVRIRCGENIYKLAERILSSSNALQNISFCLEETVKAKKVDR